MNLKSIGSWLIFVGILCLIFYVVYILFEASDVNILIKIGILLVIIGIIFFIPGILKEVKEDKVIIK